MKGPRKPGRPLGPPKERLVVMLSPAVAAWLRERGLSHTIETAIRKEMKRGQG